MFLVLLISFITAAFHAFTLIDYDWRYRFPIILPIFSARVIKSGEDPEEAPQNTQIFFFTIF